MRHSPKQLSGRKEVARVWNSLFLFPHSAGKLGSLHPTLLRPLSWVQTPREGTLLFSPHNSSFCYQVVRATIIASGCHGNQNIQGCSPHQNIFYTSLGPYSELWLRNSDYIAWPLMFQTSWAVLLSVIDLSFSLLFFICVSLSQKVLLSLPYKFWQRLPTMPYCPKSDLQTS